MNNRTVLVAGGAGYIGSHVCWHLADAGYLPVVVDDLSAGHEWAVKWGPLIRGDIGDASLIREVCATYAPSALMHFAALTDVVESVRNPAAFHDNNVTRTSRLIDAAVAGGVSHVVFSSTAAVYGIPGADGAVTEDMPLHPANPYGETKAAAETLLRERRDTSHVILRYFNAGGAAPPEIGIGEAHWPETNLLPRLILPTLGYGDDVTIYGADYPTRDGTAIRDYIHVGDLAAAHVAAVGYLLSGGGDTTLNLGTGIGHSVRQVIDCVARHTPNPMPAIHVAPRRPGDIPVMLANPDRARNVLGWSARKGLDDIVSSAMAWHSGAFYQDMFAKWTSGEIMPKGHGQAR